MVVAKDLRSAHAARRPALRREAEAEAEALAARRERELLSAGTPFSAVGSAVCFVKGRVDWVFCPTIPAAGTPELSLSAVRRRCKEADVALHGPPPAVTPAAATPATTIAGGAGLATPLLGAATVRDTGSVPWSLAGRRTPCAHLLIHPPPSPAIHPQPQATAPSPAATPAVTKNLSADMRDAACSQTLTAVSAEISAASAARSGCAPSAEPSCDAVLAPAALGASSLTTTCGDDVPSGFGSPIAKTSSPAPPAFSCVAEAAGAGGAGGATPALPRNSRAPSTSSPGKSLAMVAAGVLLVGVAGAAVVALRKR